MLSKTKNWLRENIKGKVLAQLILGSSILVLISFIVFDIQNQREILEEMLLVKGKSMALNGARVIGFIFEDAIADGDLSEAEVFDSSYQEIAATNPQKYHTLFDHFTDSHFQDIEDEFLKDKDVTYAVALDINGYIPTHNTIYSKPLTGDYETDLVGNRTKRIFSDPVGLVAVQNTQPFLWQTYKRDTGETLWDISSPIMVNGRHWGGFRVGFSLVTIDSELTNATRRILFPAIFLIIGMIFATYWVSKLQGQLEKSNKVLEQEIDQRKSIQSKLAEENELFNITLASMGDSVITTDKNGVITSFNRGAEELTGYSSAEAIGQPVEKILRITDYPADISTASAIHYLLNTGTADIPMLLNKNGTKAFISQDIYPLNAKMENASGYVIISKDITQKHRVEIQSIQSQKMESIGRLASGIAHEINTPIQFVGDNINYLNRVITRYEEVLYYYRYFILSHKDIPYTIEEIDKINSLWEQKKIEHYKQEVPNATQESLNGIERIRKIVLAINEFTRFSEKEKKYSDINHGILTTIIISQNEWEPCADVETSLDQDLPQVFCQIDEINQVILNMIVNASQAIQQVIPENSGQKGKIRISTKTAEDKVMITIQDTGCGIPKINITRIFDPFFTTKDVNMGTGQGLALAHNIIVNNHKGRIFVDSQEGKGSTFSIELPIQG